MQHQRKRHRIVFVAANAVPFGPNPAGIVLSAAIQGNRALESVQCGFLDFAIDSTPPDKALWAILAKRPDVVAFSVYGWNVAYVDLLVRALARVRPRIDMDRIEPGGPNRRPSAFVPGCAPDRRKRGHGLDVRR